MSRGLSILDPSVESADEQPTPANWFRWSDWAGMVASIGCAIHCAAMPFVIAYLPALGLSFLADESFHQWMAGGCFLIALTAFVPGLRSHGRLTPVLVGSAGLILISVAAFALEGQCCSACADAATSPSLNANAGNSANVLPFETLSNRLQTSTDDVCTDECCPHCTDNKASQPETSLVSAATAVPPPTMWVKRIVPWLTPLGGLVLVCAHVLNRRYGCQCGCCEDDFNEPDSCSGPVRE